jgi:hypothetical protein
MLYHKLPLKSAIIQKFFSNHFFKFSIMLFRVIQGNVIPFYPYGSKSNTTQQGPKIIKSFKTFEQPFIEQTLFKTKGLTYIIHMKGSLKAIQNGQH